MCKNCYFSVLLRENGQLVSQIGKGMWFLGYNLQYHHLARSSFSEDF